MQYNTGQDMYLCVGLYENRGVEWRVTCYKAVETRMSRKVIFRAGLGFTAQITSTAHELGAEMPPLK